jgi:hypothetical protein
MVRSGAWLAFVIAVGQATAGTVGGRYVGVEEPSMTLTVDEVADGHITGRLTDGSTTMPLDGRRQGEGYVGSLGQGAEALPFTARAQGERLLLTVGPEGESELITFARSGSAAAANNPAGTTAPGGGAVVINGTTLSPADLTRVQRAYQIRIPPGDYWYDKVLGAWGGRGGPTMGFITPGLDLGGALQADASGGGTNVAVNGRVLHPYDLLALQQIAGPIVPGRYFITANGLAGLEGGPPLWNLAALAAQSRAQGGGSNTWQSRVTGGSGFSDGTTGAVFLPNGGIVSTGN